MKYTTEQSQYLIDSYKAALAEQSGAVPQAAPHYHPVITRLAQEFDTTERSIVAKLASLGVYQRKTYVNKLGQPPIKKEVYVERLAKLLNVPLDRLESLEKVNKSVLILLENALSD